MHLLHQLLSVIVAGLLAIGAAIMADTDAPRLEGWGTATDGDTLRLGGRVIRLKGVDAPELHQLCTLDGRSYPCGERARAALARMLTERINCRTEGQDRYKRQLARCFAGERDIGAELVRQGLAVSYGDYQREEAMARRARVGLWSGEFQRPVEWRREHSGFRS